MTVNGVGSYGTFAVSGSSGRNVKSGQSVRFNFQAAGEKADNLLAGMKELDTGKRSSDRSILEDSGCFDSSYWSENMKQQKLRRSQAKSDHRFTGMNFSANSIP